MDEWTTPDWLFKALDFEFGFTLDGAATKENTKCKRFSTQEKPIDWTGERVFCNPPYSKISEFIALYKLSEIAVYVLPVRPDNDWYRLLIECGFEMRFFRKRIAFYENGYEQGSPHFSSLIAIWMPKFQK